MAVTKRFRVMLEKDQNSKEYAGAIEEAKKSETRSRRIEKAVAELAAGKKPR